jgi:hypothetical protein
MESRKITSQRQGLPLIDGCVGDLCRFDMVHVNPSKAYYAAYQKKAKLPSPPEKGRPRSRSNSSGGHDWRHSHPRETER